MNKLFKKLPLPVKLLLIGLLPLLFILYLSIQVNAEKTEKIEVMTKFMEQINQSTVISSLIDELQLERRYSFGFTLNKIPLANVLLQRTRTDAAITALSGQSANRLGDFKKYTFVDQLGSIRSRIEKNQVNPTEVMDYYTNAILRLGSLSPVTSENISYLQPIVKDQMGQRLLNEMISYMGTIRARLYYFILSDKYEESNIIQLRSSFHTYVTYETEFLQKSSPETVDRYNKIKGSGNVKALFDFVLQSLNTGVVDVNADADAFWDSSAKAVDELKELQRQTVQQISKKVNVIFDSEKEAKDRNLIILVVIIALVIFIIFYTTKSITDTLSELKSAAQKISKGEEANGLKVHSDDVIGSLADSIIRIDESNKQLANAASEIGKGNFNIAIIPRSNDDVLGNAILKMKNDLQAFTKENEEKIWVQMGLTTISDSIRGEKDILTLSKSLLEALATYSGAQLGLLYSAKAFNTLEFISGFAVTNAHLIPKNLYWGETLIGQAAETKKIIRLNEVPDDFVKISTASGTSQPKYVMVLPLVHNDEVEGVIELASIQPFSNTAEKLLESASVSIAIALQSAKSRTRLQELLEETQAQAEELQTQHSEMEHLNTELEAQSQRLQASEEELRVQQEELQQANAELEERTRLLEEKNQEIAERNIDIQKKATELEQSTKYKSEFLANMSHELRTPLNSILLLSRLMSDNTENNLNDEQVEYAQVIQSSGQGLLALIDEILDLSKIESGKMTLEYEHLNIETFTGGIRSLFEPLAKEKGIGFEIHINKDVPSTIETDKLRLEQVIRNLLSNAIKFTSEGSVKLEVQKDRRDGYISFAVSDTGIGIAKEKQSLVFEAFQQADGSTRRKYGGTGLGLSISRELVRLLGGEVTLQSEAGKGSCFTIIIPASKDQRSLQQSIHEIAEEYNETEKQAEIYQQITDKYRSAVIPDNIPDDRSAVSKEDKTLLIIEDDTNFAKSLLDFTHKKGYKGIVAVRGDEGIELAKKHRPAGILLDLQLPVKSGWEVMEELKKDPVTRHIPVHMMSSYEAKNESLIKGAIDFINKPVAFEQMQQVFQKLEHVLNKESKKVLIVEENPKHAKALAYFLETFNINSEIRDNVQDSVTALQSDADCVILDMGIPGQRSYEMLEEVKQQRGLENIPIIIFTGKSLSMAEEQRIKRYADSIVVKTAHSYQRILDEVSLFLHLVEENKKPKEKNTLKKLGVLNEVVKDKTVLIVDDDVRNIFSLTRALEKLKVNVVTALNGKEALQKLEEERNIDIVLLDMMMPEMDGYETARKIRQHHEWKSLPVIAVTAKAMTGDREKCIQAGASDYITKPVDIDQLISLLRVWLYERS